MSVRIDIRPKEGWNPLFPKLPFDVDSSTIFYLNHEDTQNALQVCRSWKNNPELQKAQERTWALQEGFPLSIVEGFFSIDRFISDLPELDLRGRIGSTEYIDFLTTANMPIERGERAGLARFKDAVGRVGFAMRLQGNSNGNFRVWASGVARDIPIPNLSGVIAIFRRYYNNDTWVQAGHDFSFVWHIHRRACEAQGQTPNFGLYDQENASLHRFVVDIAADRDIAFRAAPLALPPPQRKRCCTDCCAKVSSCLSAVGSCFSSAIRRLRSLC